jgi:3'-phosphoadenosine 5'-phosphosulfate sulfotransferase (PAPS reductase)/FAD synthetase
LEPPRSIWVRSYRKRTKDLNLFYSCGLPFILGGDKPEEAMKDPFKIEGPAVISFSGGRTSGYMLWRILQAHGGTLPADVVVCFANTGKEMAETLAFVNECSVRWDVPIVWIEYRDHDEPQQRWQIVSYETAARNGEPFEALIRRKNYLPNPAARFCTIEMKIRAMKLFAQQHLGFKHWDVVIGFRADEQSRVAKLSAPNREPFERFAPLAVAGVLVAEIGAFWAKQDFDLRLPNMNGKTMHGNCDLCFLKGVGQTVSLIAEQPARAVWWIKMEALALASKPSGAVFRSDRPNYARLQEFAHDQGILFNYDDDLADCACTD